MNSVFHYIKTIKANNGFTLVELLIVIFIISLTASIVAPDLFNTFNRIKVKNEIFNMKAKSVLAQEKSYFGMTTLELNFSENKLQVAKIVDNAKQPISQHESQYFIFEPTRIRIVNGEWLGTHSVILTESPYDNLELLELSPVTEFNNE